MATVINAILKDELANSYCDGDYADDYFAALPKPDKNPKSIFWSELGDAEKQQLLVQACWAIERYKFTETNDLSDIHLAYDNVNHRSYWTVPGVGGTPIKLNPFQALQFPRNIDIRTDGSAYIPDRVLMAQCEQAYYMATLDESVLASAEQGVLHDSFSGGGINVSQRIDRNGTALSPMAKQYIRPFMLKSVKRFERA
jgi:hypothetical protein